MSTQWEYYKRRYMDCDFDVLGSDGWELAAVVADPSHIGYGQCMCLFKRPRIADMETRLVEQALLVEKNNKLASLQGELLEERNARQTAQRDEAAVRAQLFEARNHVTTLEGLARQYKSERDHLEETCRMQRERIAIIERAAPKKPEEVADLINAIPEERLLSWQQSAEANEEGLGATRMFLRLLIPREQAKPPTDSDGKTPGQVDYEGYFSETPDDITAWPNLSPIKHNKHERAAQAVLRAFGQNAAEALRRVRGAHGTSSRLMSSASGRSLPTQFERTSSPKRSKPRATILIGARCSNRPSKKPKNVAFRLRSCCWAILWGCARICSFWRKAWGDKGRTAKLRRVCSETWPTVRSPGRT